MLVTGLDFFPARDENLGKPVWRGWTTWRLGEKRVRCQCVSRGWRLDYPLLPVHLEESPDCVEDDQHVALGAGHHGQRPIWISNGPLSTLPPAATNLMGASGVDSTVRSVSIPRPSVRSTVLLRSLGPSNPPVRCYARSARARVSRVELKRSVDVRHP
jgi:hypothetical protein